MTETENYIRVLGGYVRLTRVGGTELDIVNAARTSYEKESNEFSEADGKLIRFLIKENHRSPFRHVHLGLEFKTPLFVARQNWRHIVGASTIEEGTPFSEASRRYVTSEPEAWIPEETEWRSVPINSKQGSGGPVDPRIGALATQDLEKHVTEGERLYQYWMDAGLAPEQCRLFLTSYGMHVVYRWTPSLDALMNYLYLRLDYHTQYETMLFAKAVEKFVEQSFPVTYKAWNEFRT